MQSKLKDLKNQDIIVVGYWNLLLDSSVDGKNYNNTRERESVWQLMVKLDVIFIWRSENPDLNKFTWNRSDKNKEIQMDCLDFFSDLRTTGHILVKPKH